VVSDIRPEPELKADFIERNPVTTTVQVAPELSEHEVRAAKSRLAFLVAAFLAKATPVLGLWDGRVFFGMEDGGNSPSLPE
jgi:hypothetical protein